jgi:hypothetical protein
MIPNIKAASTAQLRAELDDLQKELPKKAARTKLIAEELLLRMKEKADV